ncbi:hypothetical protein D0X99_18315 [Algoriphagus lacus]|uniref:Uncharacterized protein n=1 Tax=Algoriphagus lacus TaxID=2056311 RepID=A0A418PMH6_9BACT|nr:hypothetical protein D0X99_18315 [Algoriphagus lacus]
MNVFLTFSCHVILNPRQATVRIHGTKNSYVKIDDAKVRSIIRKSNSSTKVFRIIIKNEWLKAKYIWFI